MPYGHITRLEPQHGFGWLVDGAGLDWFFVREGVHASGIDRLRLDERVVFSGPRAPDIHFEQLG